MLKKTNKILSVFFLLFLSLAFACNSFDKNRKDNTNNNTNQNSNTSGNPKISISPVIHDFGDVGINISVMQIFTISHIGTSDLIINLVTITGTNNSEFHLINYNCCEIQVTFSPTSEGIKTATLIINSNDTDTPNLEVPLSGKGIIFSGTTDVDKTAVTEINSAYNLISNNNILPAFMQNKAIDSTMNAAFTLPSPAQLEADNASADYEDAITSINTAVNLIGVARVHNASSDSNVGLKVFGNFFAGFLYTVDAASHLIKSPLGVKVITLGTNGAYNLNLPKTNIDGNDIIDIRDLNGDPNKTGFDDIKESSQAIVDSIYLLTGRKYKIVTSIAGWGDLSVYVDTDLVTKFQNTDSHVDTFSGKTFQHNHADSNSNPAHDRTAHQCPHNAIHHFARTIEYGGFPDMSKEIEKVKIL